MVSRRTRIFGLINIFIYSTVLYLILIFLIYLFFVIRNDVSERKLEELSGEINPFSNIFYGIAVFGLILIIFITLSLLCYVVLILKNYRRTINKNVVSYSFCIANLIFSIFVLLNFGVSLLIPLIIQILGQETDALLIICTILVITGPVCGILYSIYGLKDTKRIEV